VPDVQREVAAIFNRNAHTRVTMDQACTTQKKAWRTKLTTQICHGPQTSISLRCRDFVVVRKKLWNDKYLFDVELLQLFLQLGKLSQTACGPHALQACHQQRCYIWKLSINQSHMKHRYMVASPYLMICLRHTLPQISYDK